MRSASASTSGRLDEVASSLDCSPSSRSLDCLVKLGGSAITVKESLETLHEDGLARGCAAVRDAAKQSNATVVVVHGAGSFGHFHASQSGVAKVRTVPLWVGSGRHEPGVRGSTCPTHTFQSPRPLTPNPTLWGSTEDGRVRRNHSCCYMINLQGPQDRGHKGLCCDQLT
jgi:hypothetical protein